MSKQSQVMAQVTYQALFRSFPKLCGMTGTAMTDANELGSTYGLQVVQVRAVAFTSRAFECFFCFRPSMAPENRRSCTWSAVPFLTVRTDTKLTSVALTRCILLPSVAPREYCRR